MWHLVFCNVAGVNCSAIHSHKRVKLVACTFRVMLLQISLSRMVFSTFSTLDGVSRFAIGSYKRIRYVSCCLSLSLLYLIWHVEFKFSRPSFLMCISHFSYLFLVPSLSILFGAIFFKTSPLLSRFVHWIHCIFLIVCLQFPHSSLGILSIIHFHIKGWISLRNLAHFSLFVTKSLFFSAWILECLFR